MKQETYNDYERAVAAFQLLAPHLGRLSDDAHVQVARGLVERLAHVVDAEITRLSVESSARLAGAITVKPCACHEAAADVGTSVFNLAPELRSKLNRLAPSELVDLVDGVIGRPGFAVDVMGLADRYSDLACLLTDEGMADFMARLTEALERHETIRDEADAGSLAAEHDDREAGD